MTPRVRDPLGTPTLIPVRGQSFKQPTVALTFMHVTGEWSLEVQMSSSLLMARAMNRVKARVILTLSFVDGMGRTFSLMCFVIGRGCFYAEERGNRFRV